jgi:hypothetical protein
MRKHSEAFKALVKDIQANGLREPGVLFENKILDGRNRDLACQGTTVEMRWRQFNPEAEGDPAAFVESANQHRRHLTSGQRARLASWAATGSHGGDRKSDRNTNLGLAPLTIEEAAKRFGVSKTSVDDYRAALSKVCSEVDKALEEGRISVHQMREIAKLPEDKQRRAVKDWKKVREEHPELFGRKGRLRSRLANTTTADFAQWFEDLSDEEKERIALIVEAWRAKV